MPLEIFRNEELGVETRVEEVADGYEVSLYDTDVDAKVGSEVFADYARACDNARIWVA